jgi:hypothetical protein
VPALSLVDLLTPRTKDTIQTSLLARMASAGLPTSDWVPAAAGGVELSVVEAAAAVGARWVGRRIAMLAAGRFLTAQPIGLTPFPEDAQLRSDLLTYLARSYWQTERNDATFTIQNIRLTSVADAPAYDFAVGDLWVVGASGNRYQSIEAVHLPPAGSVDVRFQAEAAGSSYADVAGTITTMVTAPAGVSCVNVEPATFTDAVVTGVSSGLVTAHADALPGPEVLGVRVRIEGTGEVGTALLSFSTDGGATWTFAGPMPPHLRVNQPGFGFDGLTELPEDSGLFVLDFANGAPPSFVAGDIFTLLVGDAILQRGADAESDESLIERCRLRWTTLSDVPTGGTVQLWCHLASPEVDRVIADADPNTPGGILVTIASHGGPASAAALIACQDFIAARLQHRGLPASAVGPSAEEKVLVRSARALPIAVTCAGADGGVYVPRARLREVQAAAEAAWTAYLRSVPIGGTVRISRLTQVLMDAGARTITGEQLNGAAANVRLEEVEVAVPPDGTTLITALPWRPV